MNSPLRATPDMKTDGAEKVPILLAHGDLLPATRGGVITLERPSSKRRAGRHRRGAHEGSRGSTRRWHFVAQSPGVDAPLEQSDVVVQPVTLAAIAGLRDRPIDDTNDDDWMPTPTTPMTVSAPSAPSQQRTTMPSRHHPRHSLHRPCPRRQSRTRPSSNLKSLLDVLDPPAPLRLAGEAAVAPPDSRHSVRFLALHDCRFGH